VAQLATFFLAYPVEKTSVCHTVNGDHTSKTAKMMKVILLSSTLTF